jgi:ABC-type phosphate transport system substrate-binding protein
VNSQRKALLVANDEYEHEELRNLHAPRADAEALGRVLGDPQIGEFTVQIMQNEPAHVMQAQFEELFSESRPDDVLLLHFSGHGLKNDAGELFFAASNTRPNRLGSTAVSAEFVQRCMRDARSRSIVLLLDCCYSGAFAQGVTVRAAGEVNVLGSFARVRPDSGRGRAVITASTAMEYAFEGDRLADDQHRRPSIFTSALVEGLATGDADRDEDGFISLDELYDYVFDKVKERNPHQTPGRQVELTGELYLARSRRQRIRPVPVPADLQAALADPSMYARRGAVHELESRVDSLELPVAAGAYEALATLARTDIQYVAGPAAAAAGRAAVRPEETQLDFGKQRRGSEPVHRTIRLLGPRIARACTARASHEWIGVNETAEGLDIWIDTTTMGTLRGSVSLEGATGTAEITIAGEVIPHAAKVRTARDRADGIKRAFANRSVLAGTGVALLAAAVALGAFLADQPGHHAAIKGPQAAPSTPPVSRLTGAAPKIDCVPGSGSITLIGGAFGPIARRAAVAYMSQCKHATINVSPSNGTDSAYGVSQVVAAVNAHSAQAGSMIAMYDGVTTLAKGLTPDPVGVLIYSVVAHTGAISGSNISVAELKRLYTEPDGMPGMVGVGLQAGSGTRRALLGLWGENEPGPPIPRNCPAPSGHAVSQPTCTQSTTLAAVLGFVNGTPNAIGYLAVDTAADGHPTSEVDGRSTSYPQTSVISIAGAMPTPENVHDGSYPFVAVEHLYLSPRPTALARSFSAYLAHYLASYHSPDFTTCSNVPKSLAAECTVP